MEDMVIYWASSLNSIIISTIQIKLRKKWSPFLKERSFSVGRYVIKHLYIIMLYGHNSFTLD